MSPTQPQASSTLRSEYNLLGRSPVLQVAKLQHQSKPPKKIARIARSKSVKTGAQASEEASKVNKSKSAKTRAQAAKKAPKLTTTRIKRKCKRN